MNLFLELVSLSAANNPFPLLTWRQHPAKAIWLKKKKEVGLHAIKINKCRRGSLFRCGGLTRLLPLHLALNNLAKIVWTLWTSQRIQVVGPVGKDPESRLHHSLFCWAPTDGGVWAVLLTRYPFSTWGRFCSCHFMREEGGWGEEVGEKRRNSSN